MDPSNVHQNRLNAVARQLNESELIRKIWSRFRVSIYLTGEPEQGSKTIQPRNHHPQVA